MEEIKNQTNSAPDQENGKKEHGVFALIAVAVVLLFFGSFAWILISKPNHNINSKPRPLTDRNSCQQDSDCVLASKYYSNKSGQTSCCPINCEQEAINTQTKEKEANDRNKLCATKDYQCPVSEQCVKQSLKAVCEQGQCAVKNKIINDNANANNNSGAESPTGVYLEASKYKIGEKVIGAIRNSGNLNMIVANISVERMIIKDCSTDTKDCIQKTWKTVKDGINCGICGAKCERVNIAVSPHNIQEFNWNQNTDEVDPFAPDDAKICKKAETGTYRIKVAYYRYDSMIGANQSSDSIYLYSEEFTVMDDNIISEKSCSQDNDCVLAISNGCCPVCVVKEAINIQANQKRAELDREQCARNDFVCAACIFEIGKKKAICENNLCVVKDKASNYE